MACCDFETTIGDLYSETGIQLQEGRSIYMQLRTSKMDYFTRSILEVMGILEALQTRKRKLKSI